MYQTTIYIILFSILLGSACKQTEDKKRKNIAEEISKVEELTQAIKNDPDNAELYFQRGQLYGDVQSYKFAINDLEKAISLDSTQWKYQLLIADMYLFGKNSKEALEYLTSVSYRFKNIDTVQFKLAELQLILQQYLQSLATMNNLLNKNPGSAKAFYMKGLIYEDMGDEVNAGKNFRRATELDATYTKAWIHLGRLLTNEKNPLAIQMFENAIRIEPESPEANFGVVMFYHQSNMLEEAEKRYQEFISRFPNEFSGQFSYGILLLERAQEMKDTSREKANIQKAYDSFLRASEIEPQNSISQYYLGFTSQLLGNLVKAKSYFQKALYLNPRYEEAKAALEDVRRIEQNE